MILKIVDSKNNGTIAAVHVYENNENGELTVQDTYHLKTVEHGFDDVFGSNDEQLTVTIDVSEFKENCLIASEIFHKHDDCNDDDFYKNSIESICDKLEIGTGPISDRVYEIWSIIEEEYLS